MSRAKNNISNIPEGAGPGHKSSVKKQYYFYLILLWMFSTSLILHAGSRQLKEEQGGRGWPYKVKIDNCGRSLSISFLTRRTGRPVYSLPLIRFRLLTAAWKRIIRNKADFSPGKKGKLVVAGTTVNGDDLKISLVLNENDLKYTVEMTASKTGAKVPGLSGEILSGKGISLRLRSSYRFIAQTSNGPIAGRLLEIIEKPFQVDKRIEISPMGLYRCELEPGSGCAFKFSERKTARLPIVVAGVELSETESAKKLKCGEQVKLAFKMTFKDFQKTAPMKTNGKAKWVTLDKSRYDVLPPYKLPLDQSKIKIEPEDRTAAVYSLGETVKLRISQKKLFFSGAGGCRRY